MTFYHSFNGTFGATQERDEIWTAIKNLKEVDTFFGRIELDQFDLGDTNSSSKSHKIALYDKMTLY